MQLGSPTAAMLPSFDSGELAALGLSSLDDELGDVGDLLSLLHEDLQFTGGPAAAQQVDQSCSSLQQQLQQSEGSRRVGGRRSASSSGSGKRTASGVLKTAESQLECQKRWRAKEKTRAQDLQAMLEAKAAEAERLAAINKALRSKQELLESVVAVRDDQLRTLHTERHAAQQVIQQPAEQTTTLQSCRQQSEACHVPGAGQGIDSPSVPQQPAMAVDAQALCALQQGQQVAFTSAPSVDEPLPPLGYGSIKLVRLACLRAIPSHATHQSIKHVPCGRSSGRRIPPVALWDAAWVSRLKRTTDKEWQCMWHEFVKESSMHVLAAEGHGAGSSAYDTLTQVVSHYLGIIDRITLLVPSLYYDSLYINLATGQRQQPPPSHWVTVAKALAPTHQQIREGMTALSAFDESMSKVLQERASLTARITKQLTPQIPHPNGGHPLTPGAATAATAAMHTATSSQQSSVGGHQSSQGHAAAAGLGKGAALQQSMDICGSGQAKEATGHPQGQGTPHIQGHGTGTGSLQSAAANENLPLPSGGVIALGSAGQEGLQRVEQIQHASSDLASLTQQLSSNMAKEHAAHDMVSDFLCTRVLSVVQLARAAAVSWPWLPDVTAILKEGVAALSSDE